MCVGHTLPRIRIWVWPEKNAFPTRIKVWAWPKESLFSDCTQHQQRSPGVSRLKHRVFFLRAASNGRKIAHDRTYLACCVSGVVYIPVLVSESKIVES